MSKPVVAFRIRRAPGSFMATLALAFAIWGGLGFVVILVEIFEASARRYGDGVGVGTSAYILVEALFWIGGMLLFGLGALISGTNFDVSKE